MAAQKKCADIDNKWSQSCLTLKDEIEKWKMAYKQEKQKSDRFREQLSRTEREMYGILQRKYDHGRSSHSHKKIGMAAASGSSVAQSIAAGANMGGTGMLSSDGTTVSEKTSQTQVINKSWIRCSLI